MRRFNFTLVTLSPTLGVAVVDVGHFGQWHAGITAVAADCELVTAVDADFEVASDIAQKHGADTYSDYRDIIPLFDAISLMVPTSLHYKIAREFLEAGIHFLIEKPITDCVASVTANRIRRSRRLKTAFFSEKCVPASRFEDKMPVAKACNETHNDEGNRNIKQEEYEIGAAMCLAWKFSTSSMQPIQMHPPQSMVKPDNAHLKTCLPLQLRFKESL